MSNELPLSLGLFAATSGAFYYMMQQQQPSSKSKTLPALPICEAVFVLGGPGAGKGTQCALLQERLGGWVHLSAGDLLRAERKTGGELGELINAKIAAGELVPSSITCKLLEKGMIQEFQKNMTTKFLIDGFPRSHANMQAWIETMSHSVRFVLYFECPEEVLVGRLLERGQSSGRIDDGIDVIRKRFHTFQKESMPIVEHLEKTGTTVHKIESDRAVEEIYTKVAALF
jgi:UMP-CMP kinase